MKTLIHACVGALLLLPAGAVPEGWIPGQRPPDFSASYLAGSPGVEAATTWHTERGKADIYVVSTCAMWCVPCQNYAQQCGSLEQSLKTDGIRARFYDFIFQDTFAQPADAADAQAWIDNVWSSTADTVWFAGQILESDPNSIIPDIFQAAANAGGSGNAIPTIVILDGSMVVREILEGFTAAQLEAEIRRVFAASPRLSFDYALQPDSFAAGAPQLASGPLHYSLDATLDAAGGPVASSTNYTRKPGYTGQLYEPVSLTVSPQFAAVPEGLSNPLNAVLVLDDDSSLEPVASEVGWSVLSGPIDSVTPAGLAATLPVFTDTPATVEGSVGSFQDTALFTVLDTEPDNVEPVAGDCIDDSWQFAFFDDDRNDELDSFEAEAAAPEADGDGDSQDNFFEFLAGYDPTDPTSFFSFRITAVSDTTADLLLSKVIPGTRYNIQRSGDLGPGADFTLVETIEPVTESLEHPVAAPNEPQARGFFRIGLSRIE